MDFSRYVENPAERLTEKRGSFDFGSEVYNEEFKEGIRKAEKFAGQTNLPPDRVREVAIDERPSGAVFESGGNIIWKTVAVAVSALIVISCGFLLPSSGVNGRPNKQAVFSFSEEVVAQVSNIKYEAMADVYQLSKIYRLNMNEDPCPKPDSNLFDGNNYKDETISVTYSLERIFDSNVHFAEVIIQHPSQIRTGWANRTLGDPARFCPLDIAIGVNAVVAVNGDYAGYRNDKGIIVRQGQELRRLPCGWYTLMIDISGDFHVVPDSESESLMNEYNIVNSFAFGPSLVVDGQIEYDLNHSAGDDPPKLNRDLHPRTAVGQIGELHYLLCCVEGRRKDTAGVTIEQLAQIMYDKNCKQAYTLDGGQSTSLIINNKLVNIPLWGGNRLMSDILYFATAVPE